MKFLLLFLFAITFFYSIFACKIIVNVRSITSTPFLFEIQIPSTDSVTEKVLFTYKGEQKQVVVC